MKEEPQEKQYEALKDIAEELQARAKYAEMLHLDLINSGSETGPEEMLGRCRAFIEAEELARGLMTVTLGE